MMRTFLTATLLAIVAWFAPPAARAACTLSWVSLNFGTYTGTLDTGVNQVTVDCPSGTAYTIGLNAGTGAGATETTRLMTGPNGYTLKYQIFSNSSRTTNWGNTQGVDTVAGTGTGGAQTIVAYSQILAGQQVNPGTYTDTISTATTSFTVTALVQATCTISATALNFGTYAGTLLNAASTITVSCTNTTPYNVGLNAGTSTGASVTNRSMTGPASGLLKYKLFRDSARTSNWGNTVGIDTVAGSGDGSVQSLTVYGQLPAGQSATPGTYADTIIATITY
jgi:spore coat protein U-like protein